MQFLAAGWPVSWDRIYLQSLYGDDVVIDAENTNHLWPAPCSEICSINMRWETYLLEFSLIDKVIIDQNADSSRQRLTSFVEFSVRHTMWVWFAERPMVPLTLSNEIPISWVFTVHVDWVVAVHVHWTYWVFYSTTAILTCLVQVWDM